MAVRTPSQSQKSSVSSPAAVKPSSSKAQVVRSSESLRSKLVHAYDSVDHPTSCRLQHLQNVASWASVNAPPLGAFLGSRLASICEARGVPPPPQQNLTCERCESILQVGSNCTVRLKPHKGHSLKKGANPASINTVIYLCHYCSFENANSGSLKGYVKGKVSELSARKKLSELAQQVDTSTPNKSIPDISNNKKKTKGWTPLKEVAELSKQVSSTHKSSTEGVMAAVSEGDVSENMQIERMNNDLQRSNNDVISHTSQDDQFKLPNPDIDVDEREQSIVSMDQFQTSETEGNLLSKEPANSTMLSSQTSLEEGMLVSKEHEKVLSESYHVPSTEDGNLSPIESEKTMISCSVEVCNPPVSDIIVQNQCKSTEKNSFEGVACMLEPPESNEYEIREPGSNLKKDDANQEQNCEDIEQLKDNVTHCMDMEEKTQKSDKEKHEQQPLIDMEASIDTISSITDVVSRITDVDGAAVVVKDGQSLKEKETVEGAGKGFNEAFVKGSQNELEEVSRTDQSAEIAAETEKDTGNVFEKAITCSNGTGTGKETGIAGIVSVANETETLRGSEPTSMSNENGPACEKQMDPVTNEKTHLDKTSNSDPSTDALNETTEMDSEERNDDTNSDVAVIVAEKSLALADNGVGKTLQQEVNQHLDKEMQNVENGVLIVEINEGVSPVKGEPEPELNSRLEKVPKEPIVTINEQEDPVIHAPGVGSDKDTTLTVSKDNNPQDVVHKEISFIPHEDQTQDARFLPQKETISTEATIKDGREGNKNASTATSSQEEIVQPSHQEPLMIDYMRNENVKNVTSEEMHPISMTEVIGKPQVESGEVVSITGHEIQTPVQKVKFDVTPHPNFGRRRSTFFSSPAEVHIPEDIEQHVSSKGSHHLSYETLDVLKQTLEKVNDTLASERQNGKMLKDLKRTVRKGKVARIKGARTLSTQCKSMKRSLVEVPSLRKDIQQLSNQITEFTKVAASLMERLQETAVVRQTPNCSQPTSSSLMLQAVDNHVKTNSIDPILNTILNGKEVAISSPKKRRLESEEVSASTHDQIHYSEKPLKKQRLDVEAVHKLLLPPKTQESMHIEMNEISRAKANIVPQPPKNDKALQSRIKDVTKASSNEQDTSEALVVSGEAMKTVGEALSLGKQMDKNGKYQTKTDKVLHLQKKDITKTNTDEQKTNGASVNGETVKGLNGRQVLQNEQKTSRASGVNGRLPAKEVTESVKLEIIPRHETESRRSDSVRQQVSHSNMNSEHEVQRSEIKKAPRFIRYGRRWFSVYRSNGCVKWRMV